MKELPSDDCYAMAGRGKLQSSLILKASSQVQVLSAAKIPSVFLPFFFNIQNVCSQIFSDSLSAR